ncbi:hypothetical protein [Turicibacter bilis]|uniref:hypothetical protein n=1 Tax=Turicibacter bilis TaxID=2735723 RepID=UPI001BB05C13|nr:hypothetical protein [Turicibacter bilis]MBS3198973.1 hypothetical protein [Turicibacter bilis]
MLQKKLKKAEEKLEKVQERKAQILEEESQILGEIKELQNQILNQTLTEHGLSFKETIELIKTMSDGNTGGMIDEME